MKMLNINKYTLIGAAIIIGLFLFSFAHSIFMDNVIPKANPSLQEAGSVGSPPYPPSSYHWFGTDKRGNDLFFMLVSGAKYTIGIAAAVTFMRMIFGYAAGYIISGINPRLRVLLESCAEGFRYIPATLFCFVLLYPVNLSIALSSTEKLVIQLILMILISTAHTLTYYL